MLSTMRSDCLCTKKKKKTYLVGRKSEKRLIVHSYAWVQPSLSAELRKQEDYDHTNPSI